MQTNKIQVKGDILQVIPEGPEVQVYNLIKKTIIEPFVTLQSKQVTLAQGSFTNKSKHLQQVLNNMNKCGATIKYPIPWSKSTLQSQWNEIASAVGGTSFTEAMCYKIVPKFVPGWKLPIVIARHCFGDQYDAVEIEAGKGKVQLVFQGQSGSIQTFDLFSFKGNGVAMAFYNTDQQISQFARNCFEEALKRGLPLYLTTKNTILKKYDGRFKDIFADIYNKQYKKQFDAKKIWYEHRLIDDMVAYMVKSQGGFMWACKNYDGQIENWCIAQGQGTTAHSVSVTTSKNQIIVQPMSLGNNCNQKNPALCNPVGVVLAWSKILHHKGITTNNSKLQIFAKTLESSLEQTINKGFVVKDIAELTVSSSKTFNNTKEFLQKLQEILKSKLSLAKL